MRGNRGRPDRDGAGGQGEGGQGGERHEDGREKGVHVAGETKGNRDEIVGDGKAKNAANGLVSPMGGL